MNASFDVGGLLLETPRLILRPWEKSDLEDFFEYARVDEVGQMAGWPPHRSIEESRAILELFIAERKNFALQLRENAKVIGSVGLEELSLDPGEPYTGLPGREIGYALSRDYWGRELIPEAVRRIIEHCFTRERCAYLMCCHAVANHRSQRVIEKCDFVFLREAPRATQFGDARASRYYTIRP